MNKHIKQWQPLGSKDLKEKVTKDTTRVKRREEKRNLRRQEEYLRRRFVKNKFHKGLQDKD